MLFFLFSTVVDLTRLPQIGRIQIQTSDYKLKINTHNDILNQETINHNCHH